MQSLHSLRNEASMFSLFRRCSSSSGEGFSHAQIKRPRWRHLRKDAKKKARTKLRHGRSFRLRCRLRDCVRQNIWRASKKGRHKRIWSQMNHTWQRAEKRAITKRSILGGKYNRQAVIFRATEATPSLTLAFFLCALLFSFDLSSQTRRRMKSSISSAR